MWLVLSECLNGIWKGVSVSARSGHQGIGL